MLVCDALIFLLLSDDLGNPWRALDDHRPTRRDVLLELGEVTIHPEECALVCKCADLHGNLHGDLHGVSEEGFLAQSMCQGKQQLRRCRVLLPASLVG